jgi:putative FmdB family regulatory protein
MGLFMPLFSYHCRKCDKEMELLVDSSTVPVCRHCGSRRLDQLVSRVAPPGRSRAMAKAARAQAGREGHLSNFGRSGR